MRKESVSIFIVPLAVMAVYISFCFTVYKAPVVNRYTVADAVAKGLIKVKLKGKGGHSGECIEMEMQNMQTKPVEITFSAGRRLNSKDDGEQDLLMVQDRVVQLGGSQKKKTDLSGFCCQLSNHSPGGGSGFDLGKVADEKLLKLAQFMNGKGLPENIIQEAVWCVSDGEDISNIVAYENDLKAKEITELRKFLCTLLNKPDPWYSTPQKRIETPEREIQANPVEVFGAIKYQVVSETTIDVELKDEKGNSLFASKGKNMMKPGKYDYNFKMKIEGFEKGNYHVVLTASGKEIMDKAFSI